MKTLPVVLSAVFVSAVFVAGCQNAAVVAPIPAPASARYATGELQSGLSPIENQELAANCYGGEPKLAYDPPGVELRIVREGYALLFSTYLRVPLWVSEHHLNTDFAGPAIRREKLPGVKSTEVFMPDPKLSGDASPTNADYARSGFDRGHQAAAAMYKFSQDRTNETYYYTNMAPQIGPSFNRGAWAALEDETRALIANAAEGWVITGAIFYDPREDNPATARGLVDVAWIGRPARVAVPTHFYKIVITKNAAGEVHCHAFVLENKPVGKSTSAGSYDWNQYQWKVADIERISGINFMPNLNPTERHAIEETVQPLN